MNYPSTTTSRDIRELKDKVDNHDFNPLHDDVKKDNYIFKLFFNLFKQNDTERI